MTSSMKLGIPFGPDRASRSLIDIRDEPGVGQADAREGDLLAHVDDRRPVESFRAHVGVRLGAARDDADDQAERQAADHPDEDEGDEETAHRAPLGPGVLTSLPAREIATSRSATQRRIDQTVVTTAMRSPTLRPGTSMPGAER